MLKISKLADYGTVIMHWLTRHSDGHFSAAVIAEHTGIAAPTVSKVLKLLSDADLVRATRGAQGGYHLSCAAEKVSLAQIISAIDGRPALTECSDADRICPYDHHCEMRGHWQYVNQVIYDVLSGMTLEDMMYSRPGERHVGK